jgi:hypothetical protein
MNRVQPDGWHTVTPRIITSEAEELVRFVKKVFRGRGEFQVNRPAEIRSQIRKGFRCVTSKLTR